MTVNVYHRSFIRKALAIYDDQARHYDNRGGRARCSRMLGRILEACGDREEASNYLEKAWALKEDITGVKGAADDVDEDYNALLFYWCH